MSFHDRRACPDWRTIRDDDASSEAIEAARRHLAECESCRREALARDPTLMFTIASRRSAEDDAPLIPREAVSQEAIGRMRERVAGALAMREAPAAERRSRWSSGLGRVAAAVLLPIAAAGLIALGVDRAPESPSRPIEAVAARPAPPLDPLIADALARLPLIEGAPPVTVQEEGIGYDLVMVVDAGLEL